MEDDEFNTQNQTQTFTELKTHCINLLQLLQNPQNPNNSLSPFLNFLRRSNAESLQPFFDYTLFPLLVLLDAAIDCRSTQKVVFQEKSTSHVPTVHHRVSDSVAEGVVQCLEEILKKCHLESVDQMVVVLKKLTVGAMLSPSEASEEFREGVIKCFRALLLNINSCPDESCSCAYISSVPSLLESEDSRASFVGALKYDGKQGECLAAFLRSQPASAAVGHWLSLLLKVAAAEAERGHRGSGKLRVEAFMTLRLLVAKVGTADALAFFLPGIVSQIAKVLHVSKTMISGAAGSAEAINQAIRGLAEYLMIVLEDEVNLHLLDAFIDAADGLHVANNLSSSSCVEVLHQLSLSSRAKNLSKVTAEDSMGNVVKMNVPKSELKEKSTASVKEDGSFYVDRTQDWVVKTCGNIHKLLSATLPKICVHPSKKVRRGLLAAIQGLLTKCGYTLKESRLMLMESLCVLVLDDAEEVSATAQVFLEFLLISKGKYNVEHDIAEIFRRLVEQLPKSVLGSEESLALSQAQQLLVIMYYSGPRVVVDCLLQSPVMAARFLDVLALCVGQHSVYSGSLDKIISARSSSQGFLQSVAELKAASYFFGDSKPRMKSNMSETSKITWMEKELNFPQEHGQINYELPQMPPWFVSIGSQKLYQALAGVLRLVGLSFVTGFQEGGRLSVITDIPLGYLRKLISEVRLKESYREGWQSWYNRTGSGQLLRQANTAACILNEMMFGLTDQSMEYFEKKFQKSKMTDKVIHESYSSGDQFHKSKQTILKNSAWKVLQGRDARNHIIDCIGRILHEYISQEIWNLPVENKSNIFNSDGEAGEIELHFLRDTAILHQVIIQGIGIFSVCLGRDFVSSGFLHSSLYLLLENLTSSSSEVRTATDAVLHVLSSASGHPTVGHLVLDNADYIIDSICRQLRHLDLNPHVPNILASLLAYIGVAHKILPLLEEPMRSVSRELEILGRHQHPQLTVPFLKAVLEITKATKRESKELPIQAEHFAKCIKNNILNVEEAEISSREAAGALYAESVSAEKWEDLVFKLNDARRYRRTVGSIAGSSLTAALPLLASSEQAASVVALHIVEGAILTLAKVEETYKLEKECKEEIEALLEKYSFYQLKDTMDAADDGADENRLLPAANKIWPFIVVCIENKNTVVVRRCLSVVTTLVQTCGGDFFVRRFFIDGSHFWKLLSTSPFQKRPVSKEEKVHLQLPYRSSLCSDEPVAEVSSLKVQIAVLNMIAELSQNRRSSSALEAVFKKVSGLVVSIACSGVTGLRNASLLALEGLASIDPDLIWLLLADVYYSLKKDAPSPPVSHLPDFTQILPPPLSPKGYLYVQYGGQSYGFDIDFSSVETVFRHLHSRVFNNQAYR